MYRIYYDDGSYSDNEITQPYRVIAIVQPREKTGREVLRGHPYYIQVSGTWRQIEDLPSLVQQWIYNAPSITACVMGIWTDEDNYNAIMCRAFEDEGMPRRSANDGDTQWR